MIQMYDLAGEGEEKWDSKKRAANPCDPRLGDHVRDDSSWLEKDGYCDDNDNQGDGNHDADDDDDDAYQV